MRATIVRLVLFVLAVCFLGGQLEQSVAAHHKAIDDALGVALDVAGVLVVAGLVMLASYLRTGHPIPGHGRVLPYPLPPPPERPRPGPLEYSAEIVQLGDGVKAGPSIALVETDSDVPVLPGAGELGTAHLELAGKGNDEQAQR